MEWLQNWDSAHWLILSLVLLIGEVFIPGVFLLWWGLSGLMMSLVAWLFPSISTNILVISYGILAVILTVCWWKYQHNQDKQDDNQNTLNQRNIAMIGVVGKVEEVQSANIGRARFGDTTWRISGNDLQLGDNVKVIEVQGITLFVEKC